MREKLLVVELWGLGDLVIATPFLQAASRKYDVTLLAKPYALDLRERFWPTVKVIPFVAPWTAFKYRDKYRVLNWPWRDMFRMRKELVAEKFNFGLSGRSGDPRDHILLQLARAQHRLGFPRVGSQRFLTRPLERPEPRAHRLEYWRVLARALGIELPAMEDIVLPSPSTSGEILIHTGAGQPVRVWPLERYKILVDRLRKSGHRVQVACDPDQQPWWVAAGEKNLAIPGSVTGLLALIDRSSACIGNDSGPGHLAAFAGVPTFTIFGPQVPEWFAPLHPSGEWIEGKACPYKPCSDYCRFPVPVCMVNTSEEEVWARVEAFLARVGVRNSKLPNSNSRETSSSKLQALSS